MFLRGQGGTETIRGSLTFATFRCARRYRNTCSGQRLCVVLTQLAQTAQQCVVSNRRGGDQATGDNIFYIVDFDLPKQLICNHLRYSYTQRYSHQHSMTATKWCDFGARIKCGCTTYEYGQHCAPKLVSDAYLHKATEMPLGYKINQGRLSASSIRPFALANVLVALSTLWICERSNNFETDGLVVNISQVQITRTPVP